MDSVHKSVLLNEVVEALVVQRQGAKTEKSNPENFWYVDGTLGGAGHAIAISKSLDGNLSILGFDRDEQAILRAERTLTGMAKKVILVNEDFRNLDKILLRNGIQGVDAILLDLGFSSDELENSGRGFSFQKDEPLLMTLGNPSKYNFTAMDIVNNWDEEVIADVIFGYGEDRFARRIAKAIVNYRQKKLIQTTFELAEIVKSSLPAYARGVGGKRRIHPATKTFQALRIAVNDELNALKEGLAKGFENLNVSGRMAVISFHSLEDRIVKDFFRSKENEFRNEPIAKIITKKPIVATEEEINSNPRSRSAKLRVIEKIK